MFLFKFLDKYGKELKCRNIYSLNMENTFSDFSIPQALKENSA